MLRMSTLVREVSVPFLQHSRAIWTTKAFITLACILRPEAGTLTSCRETSGRHYAAAGSPPRLRGDGDQEPWEGGDPSLAPQSNHMSSHHQMLPPPGAGPKDVLRAPGTVLYRRPRTLLQTFRPYSLVCLPNFHYHRPTCGIQPQA